MFVREDFESFQHLHFWCHLDVQKLALYLCCGFAHESRLCLWWGMLVVWFNRTWVDFQAYAQIYVISIYQCLFLPSKVLAIYMQPNISVFARCVFVFVLAYTNSLLTESKNWRVRFMDGDLPFYRSERVEMTSSICPMLIPKQAQASRAECTPGPGVWVLFPTVTQSLMCRAGAGLLPPEPHP